MIETGRLIAEAKAELPHGAFTAMVQKDLPFGPRTAQRLMAIAADSRITNPSAVSLLPTSWGTLYELTKLDDNEFDLRIADGTIRPEMERGEIATAVKKVNRARREADLGARQCLMPDKRCGVIYADPAWRFEAYNRETGMDRSADNHYPTQSLDEIKALNVPSISAGDCVLFLWATAPMLPQALQVMEAWGFQYRSQIVWEKMQKDKPEKVHDGTGYWFRNCHELLLVGTKGKIPAPAPGTQWPSVIRAPIGAHSAKSEVFLELIESCFPTLPKIELNRRGPPRDGWSAWGNEAVK